ncbi:hypothetical protein BD626DRAFT_635724 [Schizophyllum amplum]|uniref:Uncharacterized protein n=1 Tax=Schizophyllum amplum TaxID=97359 RepID=A0A550BVG5_9AGAR|nr:hypothetical protein BD626DRAFT_635724 [Auriculariopsis ampla]
MWTPSMPDRRCGRLRRPIDDVDAFDARPTTSTPSAPARRHERRRMQAVIPSRYARPIRHARPARRARHVVEFDTSSIWTRCRAGHVGAFNVVCRGRRRVVCRGRWRVPRRSSCAALTGTMAYVGGNDVFVVGNDAYVVLSAQPTRSLMSASSEASSSSSPPWSQGDLSPSHRRPHCTSTLQTPIYLHS